MRVSVDRKMVKKVAEQVLSFIQEEVGDHPRLIQLILDEAQHQEHIEQELYYVRNGPERDPRGLNRRCKYFFLGPKNA